MTCLLNFFSDTSINWKSWIVAFCFLFSTADNAYCFDTIAIKEYSDQDIQVPSKVDLTKLPLRKIFAVVHAKFTLEFFFNNRDIFGFILKCEPQSGILVHLCFFRSCEESPYDSNQFIARPHDPPSERTFFSVKIPQGLQYEFQGLEFLSY